VEKVYHHALPTAATPVQHSLDSSSWRTFSSGTSGNFESHIKPPIVGISVRVEIQEKLSKSKLLKNLTLKLLCFKLRLSPVFQCTGNSDQEHTFRAYTLHGSQTTTKATVPLSGKFVSASNSTCCCSLKEARVFAAISISDHSLLPNLTPFLMNINKICFASAKNRNCLFAPSISLFFLYGKKALVMTQT